MCDILINLTNIIDTVFGLQRMATGHIFKDMLKRNAF